MRLFFSAALLGLAQVGSTTQGECEELPATCAGQGNVLLQQNRFRQDSRSSAAPLSVGPPPPINLNARTGEETLSANDRVSSLLRSASAGLRSAMSQVPDTTTTTIAGATSSPAAVTMTTTTTGSPTTTTAATTTTAVDPKAPGNSTLNSLHEIVGNDGVLVITLDRVPRRLIHTAQHLALGGVVATSFPATDFASATNEQLNLGCTIGGSPSSSPQCAQVFQSRGYSGCGTKPEQAIADSHRRALIAASAREMEWTAILEDDMVLVDPANFDSAFRKAWAKVPKESKIVRLSWCMIVPTKADKMTIYADAEDFVLSKWTAIGEHSQHGYQPGLCTGGYMVHRDILPEMLSLFPCCIGLDGCYFDWFRSKPNDVANQFRGMEIMMNMEKQSSRENIENITHDLWMGQHGVMFQDRQTLHSLRDR